MSRVLEELAATAPFRRSRATHLRSGLAKQRQNSSTHFSRTPCAPKVGRLATSGTHTRPLQAPKGSSFPSCSTKQNPVLPDKSKQGVVDQKSLLRSGSIRA